MRRIIDVVDFGEIEVGPAPDNGAECFNFKATDYEETEVRFELNLNEWKALVKAVEETILEEGIS